MRSLMPRAVLLVALSLGCNGPLPFMSGGALSGEVATTPAEWSAFPEFAVVQLETRPEDPYSVNIALTLVDGVLYINAGDTDPSSSDPMEVAQDQSAERSQIELSLGQKRPARPRQ